MSNEVIDGTVVEDGPGVALAQRPDRSRQVLMPLDAGDVVAGMGAYQELLPRLLDSTDYQAAGTDRDGRPRRFVKKSGWRKIARAFNLSVELVSSRVERDEHGQPVRAEVIARAIAPNGQTQDGDGYCAVDEERFGRSGGKAKLENDLRATATTRAKNRAIADLVGMGEVSAEEVQPGGATDAPAGPPAWAAPAKGDTRQAMLGSLTDVIGDETLAKRWLGELAKLTGGKVPEGVAACLAVLPDWINAAVEQHAPADDPAPAVAAQQDAVAEQPDPEPDVVDAEVVAGSTPMPDLPDDPDAALAVMRTAGCTCTRPPLPGDEPDSHAELDIDDACPLDGHGVPF